MIQSRWGALVSVVLIVEVLAIAGHLALPGLHEREMKKRAAQVVSELQLAQSAAEASAARRGHWPEDEAPGQVPPSMAPFLPPGCSFEREGYRLDWDYWRLRDGTGQAAAEGWFAAVSVVIDDTRLAGAVVRQLGADCPHMTIGNRTTLVISAPVLPSR